VILAILTDLSMDHRCHKLATSLRDLGYHPIILCDKPKHPLGKAWNGFDIRELTQVSHLDRFAKAFILFQLRLAWFLLWTRSRIWISLDCPPLLTLALFSRLRRTTAIYDSHEIFTETPMVLSRPARKWFWTRWHDGGLKFTKRIITVSPAIIEWFKQRYSGHQYWLLPNAPYLDSTPIKDEWIQPPFKIVFQGGLRVASGLAETFQALGSDPELQEFTMEIYGDGLQKAHLENAAIQFGVNDRIRFHGQVPFETLPAAMSQAHIGIHLMQPVCDSFSLTLANKLFDYVHRGLPVLLSDNPSHRDFLKSHPIGVTVDSFDPISIAKGLRTIKAQWKEMRAACSPARERWNWGAFAKGLPEFIEGRVENVSERN
jgi:glycosyltransferase involved in cell wall biosynthesis